MTDLTAVIHELIGLFDRFRLPYAIMGGIAVRAHGLPRPTFDVDFVLAVPRERLGNLFAAIEEAGYTVPEHYRGGWVDSVGGMPLFKVRLFLFGPRLARPPRAFLTRGQKAALPWAAC